MKLMDRSPAMDFLRRHPCLVRGLLLAILLLGAMVLLVGVADMIMTRAQLAERVSVPEAAATTEPADLPTSEGAALEAAGVVPDLPKDAAAEPVPTGPVLPAQGEPRQ